MMWRFKRSIDEDYRLDWGIRPKRGSWRSTRSQARKAAASKSAESLLQISVVLASITLLTRNRGYFLFGLALGAAGLAVAVLGLLVH